MLCHHFALFDVVLKTADNAHLSENPLVSFSPTIFFLAFLPPIIFNEGYNLRQQFFFGYIKEVSAPHVFSLLSNCMSQLHLLEASLCALLLS
jgi:hypothetical protein